MILNLFFSKIKQGSVNCSNTYFYHPLFRNFRQLKQKEKEERERYYIYSDNWTWLFCRRSEQPHRVSCTHRLGLTLIVRDRKVWAQERKRGSVVSDGERGEMRGKGWKTSVSFTPPYRALVLYLQWTAVCCHCPCYTGHTLRRSGNIFLT